MLQLQMNLLYCTKTVEVLQVQLLLPGVVPLTDESVEALAPTAAATSRLLKSGMTLTQVCIALDATGRAVVWRLRSSLCHLDSYLHLALATI